MTIRIVVKLEIIDICHAYDEPHIRIAVIIIPQSHAVSKTSQLITLTDILQPLIRFRQPGFHACKIADEIPSQKCNRTHQNRQKPHDRMKRDPDLHRTRDDKRNQQVRYKRQNQTVDRRNAEPAEYGSRQRNKEDLLALCQVIQGRNAGTDQAYGKDIEVQILPVFFF